MISPLVYLRGDTKREKKKKSNVDGRDVGHCPERMKTGGRRAASAKEVEIAFDMFWETFHYGKTATCIVLARRPRLVAENYPAFLF